MIADRIKNLRENMGMTQIELAKRLNITRSSVNAWEQGISVPSTQFIVELALLFKVSTDYLLCVEKTSSLNMEGLTEDDIKILHELAEHLRHINRKGRLKK